MFYTFFKAKQKIGFDHHYESEKYESNRKSTRRGNFGTSTRIRDAKFVCLSR